MTDPLAGILDGNGHRLRQRVYYEDTDFSTVVYHARYLHFLERGRTDYLRCLGIHQGQMASDGDPDGLAFVVRHMDIDFKAAARMDDVLEIVTTTKAITGARLMLDQKIFCDGNELIDAHVTIAIVNRNGRPRRLPREIAMLFKI